MSNSARAWFAERLITCITDVSVTPVEVPVAPGVLCAFCKLVITHIGPLRKLTLGADIYPFAGRIWRTILVITSDPTCRHISTKAR